MRRNRRKLAAQLLDQQLCQAVDETLIKANFLPPPQMHKSGLVPNMTAPMSALSTLGFPLPQAACLPPAPPELPMPNFSAFDLSAFSHFTFSPTTPPPLRTPTPFRTLPKWCPKIPSLTLGDVWRDCLPTFYDLSSLPEPTKPWIVPQSMKQEPCKDLQVWRPICLGYGRDQSRFFPPRSLPTAEELGIVAGKGVKVKLPPSVACRLHRSDNGIESPRPGIAHAAIASFTEKYCMSNPSTPSCDQEPRPNSTVDKVLDTDARMFYDPANDIVNTIACTPFSQMLKITEDIRTGEMGLSSDDITPYDPERQRLADPSPSSHTAEQPPYKIDGREIGLPYVHANSLIGYSNSSDVAETLPSYEQAQFLAESGVGLPIVFSSEPEDMVGLNELVVDHDIMAPILANLAAGVPPTVSLPATPPATLSLHVLSDIATILPIDCITEAEHRDSDAHYYSEQALFNQTPPSITQSAEVLREDVSASSINIADFLELGHAKQCWCGHCTDERYNAPRAMENESISSSVTLVDPDRADDNDDGLTLSLMLNPSESEPDAESNAPELLSLGYPDKIPMKCEDHDIQAVEDDGWLLFSHVISRPGEERFPLASPLYLPSSPTLHRQSEQRAHAPTVIITPSHASANELLNDYVAVAAPTNSADSSTVTKSAGCEMFPRQPRSTRETGLVMYGNEGIGCGFAKAVEGSWRWGRESEEEWWDWAVGEEC
jgi:hypothetical protein